MQSTHHVLMIRPAHFAGNEQTAGSNHFQQLGNTSSDAHEMALREFNGLVNSLRSAGVMVNVIDDTLQPHKPDALFPNNWVSFHADGTAVLYPMQAINRRTERRMEVLEQLNERGYHIRQLIDLSSHESEDQFLEGTGSLVLDHEHRMAYACLSPRTDINALGDFSQRLDYELVVFDAADENGQPIYHTNVLMCVGSGFAVLCTDAIAAPERQGVLHALQSTGHEIIEITLQQMQRFAGNMLALRNQNGQPLVAMSQTAFDALRPAQRSRLEALGGQLITAAIPTIERLGGGGVRCMIAEIFLPTQTN